MCTPFVGPWEKSWRTPEKDSRSHFVFELALTANEGIIYTLYSWRALASWPPVFVTGRSFLTAPVFGTHFSPFWGTAHVKVFFAIKSLAVKCLACLWSSWLKCGDCLWSKFQPGCWAASSSFAIVWWLATFRVWQSSVCVCACWILDLGPGCHIAYLGPAFSLRFHGKTLIGNFDFAVLGAYGFERFFVWWQVLSVWYRNERIVWVQKDRRLWIRHGMWKKASQTCAFRAWQGKANPTPVNSTWDRIEEWIWWAFNYQVGHRSLAFIVPMEFQLKALISNWNILCTNLYGSYVGSGNVTQKFLCILTGSQCQSYQISPQT